MTDRGQADEWTSDTGATHSALKRAALPLSGEEETKEKSDGEKESGMRMRGVAVDLFIVQGTHGCRERCAGWRFAVDHSIVDLSLLLTHGKLDWPWKIPRVEEQTMISLPVSPR
jgi:hypothetical protein